MKRQVIEVVCDIDRVRVDTSSGRTGEHSFEVEGTRYNIDLCEADESAFSDAVGPFVRAARVIPAGTRPRIGTRSAVADTATIRRWALEHGFVVPARGRLRPEVVAAYSEAQKKV